MAGNSDIRRMFDALEAAGEVFPAGEAVVASVIARRVEARDIAHFVLLDGQSLPDDLDDEQLAREQAAEDNIAQDMEWIAREKRRLAPFNAAARYIADSLLLANRLKPDFTYERPDGSPGVGWNLHTPTSTTLYETELFIGNETLCNVKGLGLTGHDGLHAYQGRGYLGGGQLHNVKLGPDLLVPNEVRKLPPAREDDILRELALLAFNNGVSPAGL